MNSLKFFEVLCFEVFFEYLFFEVLDKNIQIFNSLFQGYSN